MTTSVNLLAGLCAPGEPTAIDPDAFFAGRDDPRHLQAIDLCLACPLFFECQDYAREGGIEFGIYGGEGAASRKRYWQDHGGRPRELDDIRDDHVRPLMRERRAYESYRKETA